MEDLKIKIELETKKKGIFYNADVDDETIRGLRDVNKNWVVPDFIMTNTKISTGVNFDKKYIDRVYLFIAGYNSTRDIIQVSRRCRTLNDKLIKCTFLDNYNTHNVFDNDSSLVDNCPIYISMTKLVFFYFLKKQVFKLSKILK